MNIQQLQYIIALNKFRHFVKAARECGVSQPTLSTMINKFELELDVKIFDRDKSPIEPTALGKKIIKQAETIINDINRISEIVLSEKNTLQGSVQIGVLPTVAPYLVPLFLTRFKQKYKQVKLFISDVSADNLIDDVLSSNLDMAIIATPLHNEGLMEIPVYKERFLAYLPKQKDILLQGLINPLKMPAGKLWVLSESPCIKSDMVDFCKMKNAGDSSYKTGSVETLIRIVDNNGGYAVIPELYSKYLSSSQQKRLREFDSPYAVREISIVIRKDYVKEKMLNAIVSVIKDIIPEDKLVEKIKKYPVRL